jgi:hypothetical protein
MNTLDNHLLTRILGNLPPKCAFKTIIACGKETYTYMKHLEGLKLREWYRNVPTNYDIIAKAKMFLANHTTTISCVSVDPFVFFDDLEEHDIVIPSFHCTVLNKYRMIVTYSDNEVNCQCWYGQNGIRHFGNLRLRIDGTYTLTFAGNITDPLDMDAFILLIGSTYAICELVTEDVLRYNKCVIPKETLQPLMHNFLEEIRETMPVVEELQYTLNGVLRQVTERIPRNDTPMPML